MSPVITVERHELRNRKTIITVSMAPRTSVIRTSDRDSRIHTELSRIVSSRTPCGSVAFSSFTACRTPSATATMLEPEMRRMSIPMARRPENSAAERCSSCASSMRATSPRRTGAPSRTVTTTRANCAGSWMRPFTRTNCSPMPRSTRPAGASMFSRRSAATTMSGLTPSASIRGGRSSTSISRSSPPTTVTLPTPSTVSMRREIVSFASWVRSRIAQPSPESARLTIGDCRKSNRETTGVSMSSGRLGRKASSFARTSACASETLVFSSNSMKIVETPSTDEDSIRFTPSTGLTASSIFLVTSRSTASGLAPG